MTRVLRLGLLASSVVLLLVAACGGGSDDKGIGIATQAPSRPAETRTPIGVPPVQPTVGATTAPVTGGEAVAFQSADGAVTMRGNLYAAAGPKRKAVVIASYVPDTEADWQPFAKELAGTGVVALTFLMPVYKDAPNGTRDPALIDKDIEAAVLFLESRDYPLIYVIADGPASVGALKMAARRKVAGIVTVSGLTSMGNVSLLTELQKVTAPKLFLAGQDSQSPPLVTVFMDLSPAPKQSKVFDGPGTGVKLLTGPDGAAAKRLIRDFLLK